ncbi:hypothetical protein BDV34DRAFT_228228 [Aspergillus parasiticus]|uniref:Uncharacterized protein n=1 Tax=Aspergillus parasiticus TaxID=5067 RepID=A0A5N6DEI5_ASPPA|nr:hypothetical protein BDV34DRAFT_228228 [Aspergillus parasiticus]
MTLSRGNAQLLQAELDETGRGFFRLSVHGRISILPSGGTFSQSLKWLLAHLQGLYCQNFHLVTGMMGQLSKTRAPGSHYSVDYSDIKVGKRLRTGIYEAQCPGFDTVVVAKFARFHWEIRYMESETTAYEWIKDYDIGPRFLGHPVEDGRVIGFLMERISNARHAVLDDLEACWDTLSRLHALGIRHGDTSRYNF